MKKQKKVEEKVKKKVEKCAEDVCEICGNSDVDLEIMPCCDRLVCWDWCLYEMPEKCPLCGEFIFVELKDELTKESYVRIIIPTVELTKEANRLLKECRKAFDEKKLPLDSDIVERALRSYLCDLHPV